MGGGAALVAGGDVLATVRLPVAGLMSAEPVEVVAAEVRAFNDLGRELGLGGSRRCWRSPAWPCRSRRSSA